MRRLLQALTLATLGFVPAIISAAGQKPPTPIPRPPTANGEMVQIAKNQPFNFNGLQLTRVTRAMAGFLSSVNGLPTTVGKGKACIGELVLEKIGNGSGSRYAATHINKKEDVGVRVCVRVRKGRLMPVSEELVVPAARKGKYNVFRFDYDSGGNVTRQVEVRNAGRRYHVIETPITHQGPILDASRVVRVQLKRPRGKRRTIRMIDPDGRQLTHKQRKLPTDPLALADLSAEVSLNLSNFPVLPLKETGDLTKLGNQKGLGKLLPSD